MATGATYANLTHTRLIEMEDLKDRFLDHLREKDVDNLSRLYPDDGVFFDEIDFQITADDQFTLVYDAALECTDGEGNIIILSEGTDDGTAVPFANSNAVVYYVGLQHIERPIGLQNNARTGHAEYIEMLEDVGVLADPDLVTDNGDGTITFRVNSVCEASNSHVGRQVVVWLKTPAPGAPSAAVAIETCVVAYAAPNNTITTTGALGQSEVSTTASDYSVALLGPMVRLTDLSDDAGVVFVGTVTGGGAGNPPTSSDNSGQRRIDATLSGLNDALDRFANVKELDSQYAGRGSSTNFTARWNGGCCVTDQNLMYCMGGGTARTIASGITAGTPTAVNEMYDKTTDTWTSRAAIPASSAVGTLTSRSGCRAVFANSRIYLIGGRNATDVYAVVQEYNPNTNTWAATDRAPLPAVRMNGGAVVINGIVYYVAGESATGVFENEGYQYNPVTNTWSVTDNCLNARSRFAFCEAGGRFYIIGGYDGGGGTGGRMSTCEVYNPLTNTWAEIADLPSDDPGGSDGWQYASWGNAVGVNGVVHLIGAHRQVNSVPCCGLHLLYNSERDEWVNVNFDRRARDSLLLVPAVLRQPKKAPWGMPCAAHLGSFIANVDGTIIIAGGLKEEASSGSGYNVTSEVIKFEAGQIFLADSPGIGATTGERNRRGYPWAGDAMTDYGWDLLDPLRGGAGTASYGHRAASLRGQVYVTGGFVSAAYQDDCWMYDPCTNTWTQKGDMPIAVRWHGCVGCEMRGRLYVLFGEITGPAISNDILEYNPDTNEWVTFDGGAGNSVTRAAYCIVGQRIYVIGGDSPIGTPVATVRAYDLGLRLIASVTLADLPTADRDMAAVAVPKYSRGNGIDAYAHRIFVYGGENDPDIINVYDADRDAWYTPGANGVMQTNRQAPLAIYLEDKDGDQSRLQPMVIIAGGFDGATYNTSWEVHLPHREMTTAVATTEFTSPALATGHADGGIAEVDGVVFVIGGQTTAGAAVEENEGLRFGAYTRRVKVRNYTTGHEGDQVGFRAGDIWGAGSWDDSMDIDIIKIGEEAA